MNASQGQSYDDNVLRYSDTAGGVRERIDVETFAGDIAIPKSLHWYASHDG